MTNPSDNETISRQRRGPSLQELSARRQMEQSRFGRLGRLRSWGTALIGLLALALLAFWMTMTR